MLHGFLNIDKAAGPTSHDVVARVRRLAAQRRVGHGGTLDPLATGVLPIALGEATKLVSYLVDGRKGYRATIRFGISTSTDDAAGATLVEQPVPPISREQLDAALRPFVGVIQQVPPMYSAIQVGGQRLYDLARQGKTLELAPRTVEIDRIELCEWQSPVAVIDVTCGKGTYIRALARDLGVALGCGAHLAALRRTRVGPLTLDSAVTLETLAAEPEGIRHWLLGPEMAVADWPRADVDATAVQRLRNGLPIDLPMLPPGELARAHDPSGSLCALLRLHDERWRPFRVFSWS